MMAPAFYVRRDCALCTWPVSKRQLLVAMPAFELLAQRFWPVRR